MTTQDIINRLNEIYQGEPWFGESLQTKLKSVTPEMAFVQPAGDRHSIAQLVSHMEFWRRSYVEQLKGNDTAAFTGTNKGNWPANNQLKEHGWPSIQQAFEKTHQALVTLLAESKSVPAEMLTNLSGLTDHDIYHLGQIGYVKSYLSNRA